MARVRALVTAAALAAVPHPAGAQPWGATALGRAPALGIAAPQVPLGSLGPLDAVPRMGANPLLVRRPLVPPLNAEGAKAEKKPPPPLQHPWVPGAPSLKQLKNAKPTPNPNFPITPPKNYPMEVCPGMSGKSHKCNQDLTNRVCAKLLDDEGQPLDWGGQSFFDLIGRPLRSQGWEELIQEEGGDSSCISMWMLAKAISRQGCENIHINCAATGVNFVMDRYLIPHVFDKYTPNHPFGEMIAENVIDCFSKTCAAQGKPPYNGAPIHLDAGQWTERRKYKGVTVAPELLEPPYGAAPAAPEPEAAPALDLASSDDSGNQASRFVGLAAAGVAAGAAAALAAALWRSPAPVEPLLILG